MTPGVDCWYSMGCSLQFPPGFSPASWAPEWTALARPRMGSFRLWIFLWKFWHQKSTPPVLLLGSSKASTFDPVGHVHCHCQSLWKFDYMNSTFLVLCITGYQILSSEQLAITRRLKAGLMAVTSPWWVPYWKTGEKFSTLGGRWWRNLKKNGRFSLRWQLPRCSQICLWHWEPETKRGFKREERHEAPLTTPPLPMLNILHGTNTQILNLGKRSKIEFCFGPGLSFGRFLGFRRVEGPLFSGRTRVPGSRGSTRPQPKTEKAQVRVEQRVVEKIRIT